MKHAMIAIYLLLGGCVAEDVPTDPPPAALAANVEPGCAGLDDTAAAAAAATLALDQSAATSICPTGSRAVCNPSGACRCCWPVVPEVCCHTWEPYIRCNLSGVCRCSAVP